MPGTYNAPNAMLKQSVIANFSGFSSMESIHRARRSFTLKVLEDFLDVFVRSCSSSIANSESR